MIGNGYGNSSFLGTHGILARSSSGGVPPTNTVAPVISGTAQEGQTVTCSTGTWTGTPTISYTYQWKRNGSNIGSATSSTYVLVTADVSQSITCQVTATNGSGSASATSNTITPIAAVDPDAQAFITAAAITDPTQQTAINTLVVDLKGYNVWSKMKALYPFVGSTASQQKFNLKDPRDLDAAFRLQFLGGWTHSANGATPNGTNAYANTYLNPSISLAQNSTHLSYYSRTNISANQIETGVSAYSPVVQTYLLYSFSGVSYRTINRNETISGSIATPTTGLLIGSRANSTTEKYYKSGSLLSTVTVNSTGLVNGNIFLGSTNNISAGGATFYSSKQTAFSSIGDGLTDTEAANFYTAVQAFQTTLGRQV